MSRRERTLYRKVSPCEHSLPRATITWSDAVCLDASRREIQTVFAEGPFTPTISRTTYLNCASSTVEIGGATLTVAVFLNILTNLWHLVRLQCALLWTLVLRRARKVHWNAPMMKRSNRSRSCGGQRALLLPWGPDSTSEYVCKQQPGTNWQIKIPPSDSSGRFRV